MNKKLFISLVVAAFFGVGAAFAVTAGSPTTGTATACATASTPAHTIADNGQPVYTIPTSSATQCSTVTYTIPTQTVTTTSAATTTTAPATTTAPTTTTTPASTSSFTTNLAQNGTLTTPYVWTFDPGVPTTAGYFWADGKLLAKITGPGPYMYTIEPGTLIDGTHQLGHAWDLATDGSHHAPSTAYTETVTNPATASPAASLMFDGRATKMTALSSTGYTATSNLVQTQSPTLWDCVCFTNNDIKFTPDARYAQVYGISVEDGSRNPFNSATTQQCSCASAELSHRQTMTIGETDWYANAYRVPATWSQPDWDTIFQFGYPTLASPPVALEVIPDSSGTPTFSIDWNAGLLTNKNNNQDYVGSHIGHDLFLPVLFGQWVEIVIGVKWETANTGSIRVYTRVPSQNSSWTLSLSEDNIATLQYGTTPFGSCAADYSNCPTVTDHGGLYYGYWSWPGTFPSNHIDQAGLSIAPDLATAEGTFPS